jgi:tRNA (guanine37-N1)-methyltransferase
VANRFYFLTTFPEILTSYFSYSIPGRAVRNSLISYQNINLRDYTHDPHHTTDDSPFGGGPGMVMKIQPFIEALEQNNLLQNTTIILPTPKGTLLTQEISQELSQKENLVFLCGHYEGIDDRIDNLAHYKISIGDYVIGGGEIASIVMVESIIRLIDGVLGNLDSAKNDSFQNSLLDFPQYTRPAEFQGSKIPDVLLSGNHAQINRWRQKESLKWTLLLKPDMLKTSTLQETDKNLLKEIAIEMSQMLKDIL